MHCKVSPATGGLQINMYGEAKWLRIGQPNLFDHLTAFASSRELGACSAPDSK